MRLLGNIIAFIGAALWVYGYIVAGHSPVFDWKSTTPWWISDFIPNLESEIGMLACVIGSIVGLTPASDR